MTSKNLILIACLLIFSANFTLAQDFDYIGAAKCKMCHNKETTGKQYAKWLETKHSNAWKTLAGVKALEYGKENGIPEPQKEQKCLKCHSTAAAADPDLVLTITVEEGVSCESCHGAGSAYKPTTIMKNKAKSIEKGLVIPDEKVCLKCHNEENPFYKPFNFEEYNAKIAHPIPPKEE